MLRISTLPNTNLVVAWCWNGSARMALIRGGCCIEYVYKSLGHRLLNAVEWCNICFGCFSNVIDGFLGLSGYSRMLQTQQFTSHFGGVQLATTTVLLSLPSSNQFSSRPLVSPVQRWAKLMTRAQKMQQMAAMNDCLRPNHHASCFPCTQTCSIHVLELICIDWTSSLGRGGATPSYLSTQKDSAERESGYRTVGQMKLSSGYFHPCRLERSTWDW